MKKEYKLKDFLTTIEIVESNDYIGTILQADLIVFDTNTYSVFKQRMEGLENEAEILGMLIKKIIILSPGEEAKNWDSVKLILDTAVKLQLNRNSVFLGVGGGVVCDMTAFAASVYMRGAKVFLVPTTLLSMVDASFGGKTGFDFAGFKNLVGTFFPADKIYLDLGWIKYLPLREYSSGLAEVIKTAMLGDEKLLELLETEQERVYTRDLEVLTEIIKRCLTVKASIVEKDLKEGGIRATLNLGHTFGHALESVSGFSVWSHGEAVAWGLSKSMKLGVVMGITSRSYAERIINLLIKYEYELISEGTQADRIIEAMYLDKKNKNKEIVFILQRELGDTMIEAVKEDTIKKALVSTD